jgi:sarcosine oxidase
VTRVSVVGAGIMGCATAWALRERGADVSLYEQFELDHTRGSSHGRTRIFRLAYPEPEWVELAEEALGGWRDLERAAGVELLSLHGLVEICKDVESTSRDVLEAAGIDHLLLGVQEARAYGVAVPEGWAALWQPEAGVVFADLARKALLSASRIQVERRRIESLEDVDADVVVVTAGAWVTRLVPDVPVTVTRETVAYFTWNGPPAASVVELDPKTRHHAMYALHDPQYGLKAGAHNAGHVADPDVEEPPDQELVEAIATWMAERIPEATLVPGTAETCLYTSTVDEQFVLERRGRVVIGSPCSGHGFKFAPAVGGRGAGPPNKL